MGVDDDDSEVDEENVGLHSETSVRITYVDSDVDILDLRTLKFEAEVCHDARQSVHRIAWILSEHNTEQNVAAVMHICNPDEDDVPNAKTHKHTGRNKRAKGAVRNPEASGDAEDEPITPVRGRPRRNRAPVCHYNFETDGANDKARKAR